VVLERGVERLVMQDQRPGHGTGFGLPQPRGTLDVSVNRKVTVPAGDGPGAAVLTTAPVKLSLSRDSKVVGQQPFQLPRRGEGPLGHGAGGADAVDERLQPRLLVRGGTLQVQQYGLAGGKPVLVSSRPETSIPGRPQP